MVTRDIKQCVRVVFIILLSTFVVNMLEDEQILKIGWQDLYIFNAVYSPIEKKVVIFEIDNNKEQGLRWPWPRKKLLKLIKKIRYKYHGIIAIPIQFSILDKKADAFLEFVKKDKKIFVASVVKNDNSYNKAGITQDSFGYLELYRDSTGKALGQILNDRSGSISFYLLPNIIEGIDFSYRTGKLYGFKQYFCKNCYILSASENLKHEIAIIDADIVIISSSLMGKESTLYGDLQTNILTADLLMNSLNNDFFMVSKPIILFEIVAFPTFFLLFRISWMKFFAIKRLLHDQA